MFTANRDDSESVLKTRPVLAMQTEMMGGSSETDVNELAVSPHGF
jgi:hypothetical protein